MSEEQKPNDVTDAPEDDAPTVNVQEDEDDGLLPPEDDDGPDAVDFAFLRSPDDTEEPAAPEAAKPEESKEAEPTDAASSPAGEPVPAPAPTVAAPEPVKAPEAPAPAPDPELGVKAQRAFESAALEKLAPLFALSDEDIEQYTASPEKALPQLAARVMLRSVQTAVDAVKMLLPQAIEQATRAQNVSTKAEADFYVAWPQLRERADAQAAIVQQATFFRQMYPNATAEQAIKHVGASVLVSLGIPHVQPNGAPGAQSPGADGSKIVRRESLPPHRPAAATPLRELAPPRSDNPFEMMAMDDE